MNTLQFVFEKLRDGKYDRLHIQRDGRTEEIPCPKIGGVPHDMVHFAVENVMAKRGFMRRVADGEKLGFRMAPDIESDQMERLVEVMQADASSGFPPAADLIDMYHVTCDARGVMPGSVTKADILAIRAEMARLERLWNETPEGGSLTLCFDLEQETRPTVQRQK
ncbi:MAG TPA: hypothetical protein VFW94_03450 [Candidatus Acidoferrales bacterium]|nr:hypothetical protein [Candidatus Acidoferrales bacterium]